MSITKNSLAKLGGTEVVTGINLVGLVFLYYKFYELGTDLNSKIASLAGVIKKINKNTNIVNMHLKHHLFKHKTDFDIENEENENSFLIDSNDNQNIDKILLELSELKERIVILEQVNNPLLNKL